MLHSPLSIYLQAYHPTYTSALAQLFFDTVHEVCCRDYTKAQLDAWAGTNVQDIDLQAWNQRYLNSFTLIAKVRTQAGPVIAGFGNMEPGGYLDMLYVHKDYQGR